MGEADDILLVYSQVVAWVYLCAWGTMAVWEWLAPKRPLVRPMRRRWISHIALFLGGATFVNVLLPMTCVAASLWAAQQGWGLANAWVMPAWLAYVMAFVVLDLTRYGTHYLQHRLPVLWRVHRVHHTDHDVDFSTSLRFHPLELLYVTLLNVAVITALGLPALAIVAYEAVAFSVNTWNHGNVRITARAERWLRWVLVTPDMHRIHHSARAAEYNANLGALLSCWDRLLGTYVHAPAESHQSMALGLDAYADAKHDSLYWLLINPALQAAPEPQVGDPAPPSSESLAVRSS